MWWNTSLKKKKPNSCTDKQYEITYRHVSTLETLCQNSLSARHKMNTIIMNFLSFVPNSLHHSTGQGWVTEEPAYRNTDRW